MLPSFSYVRPQTVRDAITLAAEPGSRLHGGGTDLLGCLRNQVLAADRVVSLRDLAALRGISRTREGGIRIGSMTTIHEVASSPLLHEQATALATAAQEMASPQLRCQGTVGGNLCQKTRCWYYRGEFPCLRKGGDLCYALIGENEDHCIFGGAGCHMVHPSDLAPAVAALGGEVLIEGPRGARSVAAEAFHLPPDVDPTRETILETGEIVTAVVVPPPRAGLRSSYRKVRARGSWDFALASVALALVVEDRVVREARSFLGAAAPIPWRARGTEAALTGRSLDEATATAAAEAAVQGAHPLEKNGYKIPLFRGVVRRSLLDLA